MAQRRLLNKSLGTSSRKYAMLNDIAGKLTDFCHALFPLIVINADDHGILPGDAFSVKNSVFPISKHSEGDFEKALVLLHEVGLISLFFENQLFTGFRRISPDSAGMEQKSQEIGQNRYIYVHFFRREQPGIKYVAKSRFPTPPPEVFKREQLTGFRRISPDSPLYIEEKRNRSNIINNIMSAWNSSKNTLPVREIKGQRLTHLRARLKEKDWPWEQALAKFPLICFGGGKWTPNFDWFIKPGTVNAILEGKYDFEPIKDKHEKQMDFKPYD